MAEKIEVIGKRVDPKIWDKGEWPWALPTEAKAGRFNSGFLILY